MISAPLSTVGIGFRNCVVQSRLILEFLRHMIGSYVVCKIFVCRNSVVESRLISKILRHLIGPFFYAVDTLLSEDLLLCFRVADLDPKFESLCVAEE